MCCSPTLLVSSLNLNSFDFMANTAKHGIAIFVPFYIVKYRGIWQKKYEKILTSNLTISMNNGHIDLEFCMYIL